MEEGIQTHPTAGPQPIVEQVQERVKQPGNVMPSASLLPAAAESETDIESEPESSEAVPESEAAICASLELLQP